MPTERTKSRDLGHNTDGYYNTVKQDASDTKVAVLLSSFITGRRNLGNLNLQKVGSITKIEGCLLQASDIKRLWPDDQGAVATTADLDALPWVDLATFASGTGALISTNVPLGALRITYGAYSATVPNLVILSGV